MHKTIQGDEPHNSIYATARKYFISSFRDVATGLLFNFFQDIMIPGSKLATN